MTDIDFALEMFSVDRNKAIKLFEKHTDVQNEDKCLEYEEKVRVSDDVVREYLAKFGISNKNELRKLDKDERNKIIYEIKSINGVTIRQISRITGISKSVIDRIKGQ